MTGMNYPTYSNYAGRQHARDLEEDDELTHVGPGTPCGEYLRRFWQPVELASELHDLPLAVRMLGEDLVLFRTKSNEIGLLGRHCCHRGTSLEFGIVTDEGISCCYHGWHYAVDGTILDTPNDPESGIKERLRHTAYPVLEFAGLVFAYLGPPETVPDFPMFDVWQEPDTELVPYSYRYPCNWLQRWENSQDPVHSVFLHTRISGVQFAESWGELPVADWLRTPLGLMNINVRRWKGNVWVRTGETIMPNITLVGPAWEKGEDEKCFQRVAGTRWLRPIDDTQTEIIGWRHLSDILDPEGRDRKNLIGKGTTDIFGQIDDGRAYEERQRKPGDYEAIVSQGPIAIHALENLQASDKGVAMLRVLLRRGITAVEKGKQFDSPPREGGDIVPTYTQDTIIELGSNDDDRAFIRDIGARVAKIVLDSAELAYMQRARIFGQRVRALRSQQIDPTSDIIAD